VELAVNEPLENILIWFGPKETNCRGFGAGRHRPVLAPTPAAMRWPWACSGTNQWSPWLSGSHRHCGHNSSFPSRLSGPCTLSVTPVAAPGCLQVTAVPAHRHAVL